MIFYRVYLFVFSFEFYLHIHTRIILNRDELYETACYLEIYRWMKNKKV